MSILNEAYLKEQLITYIGNKRRLLPLIHQALQKSRDNSEQAVFTDMFAGSGVVSRLARLMGYQVYSNDWEEYSRILGESHLTLNQNDIPNLFGSSNSLQELLNEINNLSMPAEEERYMSLYYSPSDEDIQKADYRVERLFYTRENALRIDAIRNYIEYNFPPDSTGDKLKIRNLLIGLLLGECSRHTNTSGVFKAFHKGFGGHGKDALQRILKTIELPYPVLPENAAPARVFRTDANDLVRSDELPDADVTYMDPPYNQHQYGSNYHILNTIALWDKIPAPMILNEKGILKEKAAIRKDWIKTRSSYCYKNKASEAFSELLKNTRSKRILISYSNDGVIPFETMMNICEEKGKISIISNEYTKYRGGRQSNHRLHSNIEFVMAVDTGLPSNTYSRNKIRKILLLRELALMEKKVYKINSLAQAFGDLTGCEINLIYSGNPLRLNLKQSLFLTIESNLKNWSSSSLKKLLYLLESCACKSRTEELKQIFSIIEKSGPQPAILKKELPRRIRMLAHKKTKAEYREILTQLDNLRMKHDMSSIDRELDQIKIQAEKRFEE
ncbi:MULTISPECIES: DNA adenine methylase [unclassified Oceanispirochaeta]|uniref:DNA adenine methylase n=1 Tax=unclassified Oceanispirochaeta TaxID=2635722 RepID=UPI00131497B8|nr:MULTISPECIES: DNA adenine methylase [unclassified Oceanispirochaeta]MBF9017687.1 DNA adenine methylase [Oceanispirochaeta sp. M2]NPD74259.1 DNA methyltransferase [Oceanispirochaeta sp. M1]